MKEKNSKKDHLKVTWVRMRAYKGNLIIIQIAILFCKAKVAKLRQDKVTALG